MLRKLQLSPYWIGHSGLCEDYLLKINMTIETAFAIQIN